MINAKEAKKNTNTKKEEYRQRAATQLMDIVEKRIIENSNSGFYSCYLVLETPNGLKNSEYEEIIINTINTLTGLGYIANYTLRTVTLDKNTYSINIKWE